MHAPWEAQAAAAAHLGAEGADLLGEGALPGLRLDGLDAGDDVGLELRALVAHRHALPQDLRRDARERHLQQQGAVTHACRLFGCLAVADLVVGPEDQEDLIFISSSQM